MDIKRSNDDFYPLSIHFPSVISRLGRGRWEGDGPLQIISEIDLAEPDCRTFYSTYQWIGLRENLQETMVFTIKYRAFL